MRGAFITLEGLEGVGKSTNVALVADWLRARGKSVVATREPGGTPLAEAIRDWVLGAARGALSAEIETLLMFAARADHLDRVIRPALAAGQWVVCDRFTDATVAYQGGGRGVDSGLVAALKAAVQRDLEPDVTFLLDAPVGVSAQRIADRPLDHFEQESRQFFERARARYLALARQHPGRIRVVDAAQSLAAVQSAIETQLDAFIARFAA